jgi:hypothetical protein
MARIHGVERTQVREILGGIGFGQMDLLAHFGLGDANTAKSIRIEWPSGTVQTLGPVDSKQTLTVHEPPQVKHLRRDGEIWHLNFIGVAQGVYQVQGSRDLQFWEKLAPEPSTSLPGAFEVQVSDSDRSQQFFRIVEF